MELIELDATAQRALELLTNAGMSDGSIYDYTHTGFGSILRHFHTKGILYATAEMLDNFFHHTEAYQPPKNAESLESICKRTQEFYEELIQKEELQDKTILIASHGCAVRALLQNVYENPSIENFWRGCVPPNCSVNIIEVKNKISKLIEEDKIF